MSAWIKFVEITPKAKTRAWVIQTIDGTDTLGVIGWFNAWRRYAFFTDGGKVFEQDCLRRIADFIEDETKKHKEKQKSEKSRIS